MVEEAGKAAGVSSGEIAPSTKEIKDKPGRREIKGGIPYVTSPGVLKKALEIIVQAERPDKFSANYMATVLKLTGGSAREVPPFLKKMQFIGSDAAPTLLYSKFKTDGGRSQAAYEGLKNSFGELFRRNEYIYKAEEAAVKDVIVEITGLKKNDNIVRLMYATFEAVRGFVSGDVSATAPNNLRTESDDQVDVGQVDQKIESSSFKSIGLSYQINIVLPETDNISVFNAIFKSLRENLLR
ncbi:DUF5343 domain-containing protein [Bosea sp. Tri-44]|uniref:DUF5343 domain-containing protein n=1 Tax=Bosea sp. Tri-44 TaxID=1972137 RepID=UPI00100FA75A|nr:DUF5343 domain-containing protein [Bosea sp. Tri-44]